MLIVFVVLVTLVHSNSGVLGYPQSYSNIGRLWRAAFIVLDWKSRCIVVRQITCDLKNNKSLPTEDSHIGPQQTSVSILCVYGCVHFHQSGIEGCSSCGVHVEARNTSFHQLRRIRGKVPLLHSTPPVYTSKLAASPDWRRFISKPGNLIVKAKLAELVRYESSNGQK